MSADLMVLESMRPELSKIMHAFSVSTFETVSFWFKNYNETEIMLVWDIETYLWDLTKELRSIQSLEDLLKLEWSIILQFVIVEVSFQYLFQSGQIRPGLWQNVNGKS